MINTTNLSAEPVQVQKALEIGDDPLAVRLDALGITPYSFRIAADSFGVAAGAQTWGLCQNLLLGSLGGGQVTGDSRKIIGGNGVCIIHRRGGGLGKTQEIILNPRNVGVDLLLFLL